MLWLISYERRAACIPELTGCWELFSAVLPTKVHSSHLPSTSQFFQQENWLPIATVKAHHNKFTFDKLYTLQETNISHLGKRKIIFKHALSGSRAYVSSLEGIDASSLCCSGRRLMSSMFFGSCLDFRIQAGQVSQQLHKLSRPKLQGKPEKHWNHYEFKGSRSFISFEGGYLHVGMLQYI